MTFNIDHDTHKVYISLQTFSLSHTSSKMSETFVNDIEQVSKEKELYAIKKHNISQEVNEMRVLLSKLTEIYYGKQASSGIMKQLQSEDTT